MGIFGIFQKASAAERAQKLKSKLFQKYGDPLNRQKAIENLAKEQTSEAIGVLLLRFTFVVEPQTTDADEKDNVFEIVTDAKEIAVAPVREFFTKNEQASSWMLRILEKLLPRPEVTAIVQEELGRLGTTYTRDPQKKQVLLQFMGESGDASSGAIIRQFLGDMSDDVKLAAVKALATLKDKDSREAILALLVEEETGKRVQHACIEALADAELPVTGFREKVEARLQEGFIIERSGLIKRRTS